MNRLSLLVLGLLFLAPPAASAADKPNFLFVFADDQRHDAMSVVQKEQCDKDRLPWFTTPNMGRLAAEGRFRNAFVVNSLCSPSWGRPRPGGLSDPGPAESAGEGEHRGAGEADIVFSVFSSRCPLCLCGELFFRSNPS